MFGEWKEGRMKWLRQKNKHGPYMSSEHFHGGHSLPLLNTLDFEKSNSYHLSEQPTFLLPWVKKYDHSNWEISLVGNLVSFAKFLIKDKYNQ